MSEFSFYNGDNFIRNLVTVVGAGCRPLFVPPVSKEILDRDNCLPISMDDLMLDLRIDDPDTDEPLVRRIAMGAAAWLEARTAYVITPGEYTVEIPGFWPDVLNVNRGPIREITGIEYMTARDQWSNVVVDDFYAMATTPRSFGIKLLSGFTRPSLWSELPVVRIKFTAGFFAIGESETDNLKQIDDGLLTTFVALCAHLYQHRELFEADKAAEIEPGMGSLLQAYRKYW